jgi:hypothetical protein
MAAMGGEEALLFTPENDNFQDLRSQFRAFGSTLSITVRLLHKTLGNLVSLARSFVFKHQVYNMQPTCGAQVVIPLEYNSAC